MGIMLEPPDDASPEIRTAYDNFNKNAIASANSVLESDKAARKWRLWLVAAIALIVVLGSFLCVYWITRSEIIATAIAGGAVVIGVLAVAGWMNPLQTIERDIIMRRWSDAVAASFALQLSDDGTNTKRIAAASRLAAVQFAALAASYGTLNAEVLATVKTIAAAAPSEGDDDQTEDNAEETAQLTITTPKPLTSKIGQPIEKFTVDANGPDDLAYSYAPPIDGVTLGSETGAFEGTPSDKNKAMAYDITVTVESEAAGRATGSFSWTLER